MRYWETKRGRRRIPLRSDFEPIEIPRLLPHLHLVERIEGKGFRYRLTGTAIVQGYGFDATGKFTHEALPPARHAVASRHYVMVFESGRPLFARNRYLKGCAAGVFARLIGPRRRIALRPARASASPIGAACAGDSPHDGPERKPSNFIDPVVPGALQRDALLSGAVLRRPGTYARRQRARRRRLEGSRASGAPRRAKRRAALRSTRDDASCLPTPSPASGFAFAAAPASS